jgi:hypothetical protein
MYMWQEYVSSSTDEMGAKKEFFQSWVSKGFSGLLMLMRPELFTKWSSGWCNIYHVCTDIVTRLAARTASPQQSQPTRHAGTYGHCWRCRCKSNLEHVQLARSPCRRASPLHLRRSHQGIPNPRTHTHARGLGSELDSHSLDS